MQVETTRFGILDVSEDKKVSLPSGIYGFESLHDFTLLPLGGGVPGFYWMQSLTEPGLAFLLADPTLLAPSYAPEVGAQDLAALGLASPDDAIFMVICSVPEDFKKMTANLQAPLVFNPVGRVGCQLITGDPSHALKHEVFATGAAAAQR